ncbi:MAG: hypothetical protein EON55_00180 [Alphaproteobacteria bacterium]|nr:MAG: hypothetical protein EON55_00180 [Alphaproteobacteria bacterium]
MTTALRSILARCSGVIGMAALILPADAFAGKRRPKSNATPFGIIGAADMSRSGMQGAGCAWMDGLGRSIRFVSSEDRALVKVDGAARILHPAPDAPDAFPFTYDRWVGDGIMVTVVRYGRTTGRGESTMTPAILNVVLSDRSFRSTGLLDCGT